MTRSSVHQVVLDANTQSGPKAPGRISLSFHQRGVARLREEAWCSMLPLEILHREIEPPGDVLELIPSLDVVGDSDLCSSLEDGTAGAIWAIASLERRYAFRRNRS
jgi:hypothetical protein